MTDGAGFVCRIFILKTGSLLEISKSGGIGCTELQVFG